MPTNLPLVRGRGGNRHPIAVKQFILDQLARVGEDNTSGLHRAFKDALDRMAEQRRRKFYYKYPTYPSFYKKVWELIQEGLVEHTGREEPSNMPNLKDQENAPPRKFLRLSGRR